MPRKNFVKMTENLFELAKQTAEYENSKLKEKQDGIIRHATFMALFTPGECTVEKIVNYIQSAEFESDFILPMICSQYEKVLPAEFMTFMWENFSDNIKNHVRYSIFMDMKKIVIRDMGTNSDASLAFSLLEENWAGFTLVPKEQFDRDMIMEIATLMQNPVLLEKAMRLRGL